MSVSVAEVPIAVEASALRKALDALKPLVDSRTYIDEMECILIKSNENRTALSLSATNGDCGATITIPARVSKDIEVLVTAEQFRSVIPKTGGVMIRTLEDALEVLNDLGTFQCKTKAPEGTFWKQPECDTPPSMTIRSEEWDRIGKITQRYQQSRKEYALPVLAGVHVVVENGQVHVEASDNFRLVSILAGAEEVAKTPGRIDKVVSDWSRLTKVIMHGGETATVFLTDHHMIVRTEGSTAWSVYREGVFPQSERLFDKPYESRGVVPDAVRKNALKKLRLTKAFVEDRKHPKVCVRVADGDIAVSVEDVAKEQFESEGWICLNPNFLADALESLDNLEWSQIGPTSPIQITSGSVKALVLPIKPFWMA